MQKPAHSATQICARPPSQSRFVPCACLARAMALHRRRMQAATIMNRNMTITNRDHCKPRIRRKLKNAEELRSAIIREVSGNHRGRKGRITADSQNAKKPSGRATHRAVCVTTHSMSRRAAFASSRERNPLADERHPWPNRTATTYRQTAATTINQSGNRHWRAANTAANALTAFLSSFSVRQQLSHAGLVFVFLGVLLVLRALHRFGSPQHGP